MYMLECYKATLTIDQFINLSIKEIKKLCEYAYGIEVTPEVYYSINRTGPVSYLPEQKTDETLEVFYFIKKREG